MATAIFPETGDTVTQSAWSSLSHSLVGASHLVSGFDVTYDGSGLDVDVAAGTAVVGGFEVVSDAAQEITGLTASNTNYLWLESSGTLSANTSGSAPSANALLLGTAVTDGSGVTALSRDEDVTTGRFIYVTKKADESIASSTSLQDDDDLTVTVQPGIYQFEFLLNVTFAGAVGLKVSPVCTATNYTLNAAVLFGTDSTTTFGTAFIAGSGNASFATASATAKPCTISGVAAFMDGGTFKLQWAQGASGVTDTTVKAGSRLLMVKIA